MKPQENISKMILIMMIFQLNANTLISQDFRTITMDVDGRQYSDFAGPIDEFTIVSAPGISWVKITDNFMGIPWENAGGILYDGVPVIGSTTVCRKRKPPCVGCGWLYVGRLYVTALGQGSLTLSLKPLGLPPYPEEGDYIEMKDPDGQINGRGSVVLTPENVQPGAVVNVRVTIPSRLRQHIDGLTLSVPTGDPYTTQPLRVSLPFDPDGVYDYTWRVPLDILGPSTNPSHGRYLSFEANANKSDENGRFGKLLEGGTTLNVASTLALRMGIQNSIVPLGSNNTWDDRKTRSVYAVIEGGRSPFKSKWFINGEEITTAPDYLPPEVTRRLENQNALADAGTITFEVTDANGNAASGTIYIGIDTDLSFEFSVQGEKVQTGSTVMWREGSAKQVTVSIKEGRMPLKTRWLIDGSESVSTTLVNTRHGQYTDQEILGKANTLTLEVTDANNLMRSGTIYFGNPEEEQNNADTPPNPVGPPPIPPPLTGNPDREPNSTVEWNNRPWLDERVRECARQYLQNIVFYVENEYVKWENTGLPANKQKVLFTSIDDWGRILNQYMSTTGGVDGNWDNPTHFVWSEFNKPRAAERYGRTVDYYCKYECNLLEPSPDDINNAINDISDDNENNKWDPQKIKNAQNNLNDLLDLARSLYNQLNLNYNKFVNEINDQNSNPVENEIIALCLASAQNQFGDHSVNKDSIDVSGNALIAQSATNSGIDIFGIIRILSEVQVQSDDMIKKLDEMKSLLGARGGDIDEIISSGERLIAQGNVNPEFAQDGGVNIEFIGDGIDNFGDGLQDYIFGNIRRGNVLIVIWDIGEVKDDIFELIISARGSLGTTPPGGRRNFDITLDPGIYTISVRGVYTDPNHPPCTFGMQVYDRDLLILQEANSMEEGQELSYSITVR